MAPKISLALGFQEYHEQLHTSPSILVGGVEVDLDDDWDEPVKPRRRSSSVEAALGCFTSLSCSVRSALSKGARQLYSRRSPRRGGQHRNSMVEISSSTATARSLSRANSMPATHRSSESDLDLFGDVEEECRSEHPAEACSPKIEAPSPWRGRLSRLRSWTQGSK
jgi:hypothetical protein